MEKTSLPELQDEVKHNKVGVMGVVIARYPEEYGEEVDGILIKKVDIYLHVRLHDNRIVYHTPAKYWTTIQTEEERM